MSGSLISGYFAISPHDIKRNHNDTYAETNTIYESSEEEEKQEPIFYLLSKNQRWSSDDLVITKIERDRIEGKSKPKKTTDDLPEKQVNDSINSREKNGMTAVIETLCFMANLDLTHRSKAAGIIKMVSDEQGTNAPSQQTINKYLNNITDKKV
jgi:hypothetical protein